MKMHATRLISFLLLSIPFVECVVIIRPPPRPPKGSSNSPSSTAPSPWDTPSDRGRRPGEDNVYDGGTGYGGFRNPHDDDKIDNNSGENGFQNNKNEDQEKKEDGENRFHPPETPAPSDDDQSTTESAITRTNNARPTRNITASPTTAIPLYVFYLSERKALIIELRLIVTKSDFFFHCTNTISQQSADRFGIARIIKRYGTSWNIPS